MKVYLLFIFILLTFSRCTAQEEEHAGKRFTPSFLKEDMDQLLMALQEFHPGIDRHVSLKETTQAFEKVKTSVNHELSDWEFYRLVAPLVASIQCGHTRLSPSDEMQAGLDAATVYFPLQALSFSEKVFVKLPDNTVAELLKINGEDVRSVLRKILSSFPVDGSSADAKYDYLNLFGVYYARYVDPHPDTFDLVIRKKDQSQREEVSLPPAGLSEVTRDFAATKPIEFSMIGDTGYLRVQTFSSSAYHRHNINYYEFLENTFVKLKNGRTERLIIDIRGNGGGDDQYGATLYRYLARESFHYFKRVDKKNGNEFMSVNHPCLALQHPKENRFAGQVALLINGRTFSTAADVASMFKSNKRAVIIGRETGGGYDGNTSGASERITLKNTKLSITIPLWFYENDVLKPEHDHRGVMPDVRTQPEPGDLFNATDRDLQLAIKTASH
jgi:hypothetical protein